MLRELKKHNEVTYLSLCPNGTEQKHLNAASEYSHHQIWIPWNEAPRRSPKFFLELGSNVFSKLPYAIHKYESRGMADKIRELDRQSAFELIICDFLMPAVNLFAGNYTPKTKTLLFQHNAESLIWQRHYEKTSHPLKRAYFYRQWQRMIQFETWSCARCDTVVGVSDDDCRIMREDLGLKNVLGAVPTGVDVPYFAGIKQAKKPRSMAFLGSMDWMPNIDAMNYFVREIYPLVKQKSPDVSLAIVGRNPPPLLREMASNDASITVTGTVDDVRPYLAEAEVMIVPLRIGGGTRIKIYEGMAAGIPIVSTAIGAEGLPLTHREHIVLADSPDDFANGIGELFQKPDFARSIADNGRRLVQEKFSWEAATNIFEDYCRQTVAK